MFREYPRRTRFILLKNYLQDNAYFFQKIGKRCSLRAFRTILRILFYSSGTFLQSVQCLGRASFLCRANGQQKQLIFNCICQHFPKDGFFFIFFFCYAEHYDLLESIYPRLSSFSPKITGL